jgi:hypothetical protein
MLKRRRPPSPKGRAGKAPPANILAKPSVFSILRKGKCLTSSPRLREEHGIGILRVKETISIVLDWVTEVGNIRSIDIEDALKSGVSLNMNYILGGA